MSEIKIVRNVCTSQLCTWQKSRQIRIVLKEDQPFLSKGRTFEKDKKLGRVLEVERKQETVPTGKGLPFQKFRLPKNFSGRTNCIKIGQRIPEDDYLDKLSKIDSEANALGAEVSKLS